MGFKKFFRKAVRFVTRYVAPVVRILSATTPLGAILATAQFTVSVVAPKISPYASIVLNFGGGAVAQSLGYEAMSKQLLASGAIAGASAVDPRLGALAALSGTATGATGPAFQGQGVFNFITDASGHLTQIAILVRREDLAEALGAINTLGSTYREITHLPDGYLPQFFGDAASVANATSGGETVIGVDAMSQLSGVDDILQSHQPPRFPAPGSISSDTLIFVPPSALSSTASLLPEQPPPTFGTGPSAPQFFGQNYHRSSEFSGSSLPLQHSPVFRPLLQEDRIGQATQNFNSVLGQQPPPRFVPMLSARESAETHQVSSSWQWSPTTTSLPSLFPSVAPRVELATWDFTRMTDRAMTPQEYRGMLYLSQQMDVASRVLEAEPTRSEAQPTLTSRTKLWLKETVHSFVQFASKHETAFAVVSQGGEAIGFLVKVGTFLNLAPAAALAGGIVLGTVGAPVIGAVVGIGALAGGMYAADKALEKTFEVTREEILNQAEKRIDLEFRQDLDKAMKYVGQAAAIKEFRALPRVAQRAYTAASGPHFFADQPVASVGSPHYYPPTAQGWFDYLQQAYPDRFVKCHSTALPGTGPHTNMANQSVATKSGVTVHFDQHSAPIFDPWVGFSAKLSPDLYTRGHATGSASSTERDTQRRFSIGVHGVHINALRE
eukprot:TRINITY_DN1237_c1_g1_i1.p1 TRINITY_DN1237_c1_g1~~TRINITY_DN1237_c1_g1_i1.p1  ORF type:complete len:666 (-),score=103.56 TRINITY_DN1237_c1_g1_i1:97-2094(-)